MSKKIEIDEAALSLEIELVADEVIETLLSRAQQYEAENRATVNPGNALRAASPVGNMVSMMGLEPLSQNELRSIESLLAYTSHNQNIKQETVRAIVADEFGVKSVSDIQRLHYERAIQFLVDLRLNDLN